jgi:hypothetical protein
VKIFRICININTCPNVCSSSVGLPAALTAKKTISAATRSTPECIASDRIETAPEYMPTISMRTTNEEFGMIDNAAMRLFLLL